MAVQLELPVRPRGEPVVVVAVQHDRRVRTDPRVGQQLAEVLARCDVAADPVGQLAGPVPADGARDVALLVGRGVDVDLDEADVRVVEVVLRPVGVDEGGLGGVSGRSSLAVLPVFDGVKSWVVERWSAVAAVGSVAGRSVASAELGKPLGTVGGGALRLAHDPRVDPARVLDGQRAARSGRPRRRCRSCCGSRPSSSPGAGGRRRRRPGPGTASRGSWR